MLPSSLTPPPDASTSHDVQLNLNYSSPAPSNPMFATPMSNNDMGLDNSDSRSHRGEERSDGELEDQDMSDEDMEDGGAALSLTASNVQQLNYTMETLETQTSGAELLLGLFHSTESPSQLAEDDFLYSDSFPPSQHPQTLSDIYDEDMDNDSGTESDFHNPDVPETITEVSQQLQNLQNIQDHADVQDAPVEQHTLINNSITPFHFPPHLNMVTLPFQDEGQFVSMADIAAANSLSVAATPSQNAPHLWSTEGATPSPLFDTIIPTYSLQMELVLQQQQIVWGEGDADLNEVEDNINFGLGDFLYDWGARATAVQATDMRRRFKGPSLPELHAQRFPQSLPPVKRKDLQGEQCDIQR